MSLLWVSNNFILKLVVRLSTYIGWILYVEKQCIEGWLQRKLNEEHDGLQIKILPIVKVKFHLELRMDRIKASERRREGQKWEENVMAPFLNLVLVVEEETLVDL